VAKAAWTITFFAEIAVVAVFMLRDYSSASEARAW